MTRRSAVRELGPLTSPGWVLPLGWWLAFQPWWAVNVVGLCLAFLSLIYMLIAFVAFAALVVGPPLTILRRYRSPAVRAVWKSAVFLASFVVGFVFGELVRRDGVERVIVRGTPLVAALNAYIAANGQPPPNLAVLVPAHIAEIPSTGIGTHPDFYYTVGKPNDYDGNPWVLQVVPPCVAGFDVMLYFPLQNYPESGYGGRIERIGTWGYVHE